MLDRSLIADLNERPLSKIALLLLKKSGEQFHSGQLHLVSLAELGADEDNWPNWNAGRYLCSLLEHHPRVAQGLQDRWEATLNQHEILQMSPMEASQRLRDDLDLILEGEGTPMG